MPDVAKVTGNAEDGWNVEAIIECHAMKFACVGRDDAHNLCALLNRCSWFEVKPQ